MFKPIIISFLISILFLGSKALAQSCEEAHASFSRWNTSGEDGFQILGSINDAPFKRCLPGRPTERLLYSIIECGGVKLSVTHIDFEYNILDNSNRAWKMSRVGDDLYEVACEQLGSNNFVQYGSKLRTWFSPESGKTITLKKTRRTFMQGIRADF